MRRLAPLLVLALLLAAGCGGDDDAPVQGPPAERFGMAPIEGVVTVEQIRSELVAASDLAAIGRRDAALAHLRAARRGWSRVSAAIRRGDAVLEREVSAAFALVEGTLQRATTFDAVRDRLAPLGAQLLGGVREELVADKRARLDPGVNATAIVELLEQAAAEYASGDERRREHAFGLIDRAQAVARDIEPADFGGARRKVLEGLRNLREAAFPEELLTPPGEGAPSAEVAERIADVQTALRDRFELPAA